MRDIFIMLKSRAAAMVKINDKCRADYPAPLTILCFTSSTRICFLSHYTQQESKLYANNHFYYKLLPMKKVVVSFIEFRFDSNLHV